MNMPATPWLQERLSEFVVRDMCRRKYREEGCTQNNFAVGTYEFFIWNSEASQIESEESQSAFH